MIPQLIMPGFAQVVAARLELEKENPMHVLSDDQLRALVGPEKVIVQYQEAKLTATVVESAIYRARMRLRNKVVAAICKRRKRLLGRILNLSTDPDKVFEEISRWGLSAPDDWVESNFLHWRYLDAAKRIGTACQNCPSGTRMLSVMASDWNAVAEFPIRNTYDT